ncbi:hypothetical protein [Duganella caerulea]|uniref:hypothetical protein n=1 Tax=Duganella caerulea TaxID=2885762 RepID=UPI0040384F36
MSTTSHQLENAISKLTYPFPLWRYFIIFQSWFQFTSWAFAMMCFSAFSWLALDFFDPNTVPIAAILSGGGIGSMLSVISVIPAQFTIFNARPEDLDFLIKRLEYFGYIKESDNLNCIVFHQNLPRLLRWNEGNVAIWSESGNIKVGGAVSILQPMRRKFIEYSHPVPD